MFDQVFQNLQKATESSMTLQQEMFKKWMESMPGGAPVVPSGLDLASQWKDKWEGICTDMVKRQKEMVDKNYDAGIKALEDIFKVAAVKNPLELQEKVVELYRKSFDSLRQLSESQMTQFKEVAEKWSKLVPIK